MNKNNEFPEYCEKCGMKLIKTSLNYNEGGFDPKTGERNSNNNFRLKCPKSGFLDVLFGCYDGHTNIKMVDGDVYDLHVGGVQ